MDVEFLQLMHELSMASLVHMVFVDEAQFLITASGFRQSVHAVQHALVPPAGKSRSRVVLASGSLPSEAPGQAWVCNDMSYRLGATNCYRAAAAAKREGHLHLR